MQKHFIRQINGRFIHEVETRFKTLVKAKDLQVGDRIVIEVEKDEDNENPGPTETFTVKEIYPEFRPVHHLCVVLEGNPFHAQFMHNEEVEVELPAPPPEFEEDEEDMEDWTPE